jgi:hypothetical protein
VSVRTPPTIVPRDPFGMPVQWTSLLLSALPAAIANRLGMVTARSALTCRMPSTSRGSLRGHLFEARRASLRLAGHIERYLR